MSKRISGITELNITKFAHDVVIFYALLTCPSLFWYSNPFQNASTTNEGMSAENADFAYKIGYHGNVPWAIANWLRPLSLNAENLVKIRPVDPEISCFIGGPRSHLKKERTKEQNIGKTSLFHRRTRASYVYNVCLAWYNVVLTPRIHSSVKFVGLPLATRAIVE